MNLIDDTFQETPKIYEMKKQTKVILILILILIIAIIAILCSINYIKSKELKFYLDGSQNNKLKELVKIDDDGTIYFPIKTIAPYLKYESFNGEYSDKSEVKNKCYIQCSDEIANFTLNSNKIYKLTTSSSDNYEYFYAKRPVKAINGVLYASSDAIERAFNVSFTYDEEKNQMYIYTMPYLISYYSKNVIDYGYDEIDDNFINEQAVLNNMLVVTKDQKKIYAVIDLKGNAVIEAKYDNILYLPNSNDFLVTSDGKKGIISSNAKTKVGILYDNIELIDTDAQLYLAQRDKKYGVIDSNGKTKIYIEYDQIGIDSSKFQENDIKNKYLLDNGLIPAKKGSYWGAFDKDGNTILKFDYEELGYVSSGSQDIYNLLLIPDYNVLVAKKNKKYTLIDSSGNELCAAIIDDAYIKISGGEKYYYMNYANRNGESITDYLDSQKVKTSSSSNSSQYNNVSTKSNNNTSDSEGSDEQNAGESSSDEKNSNDDQNSDNGESKNNGEGSDNGESGNNGDRPSDEQNEGASDEEGSSDEQ